MYVINRDMPTLMDTIEAANLQPASPRAAADADAFLERLGKQLLDEI